jgi:hypothetical protein
VTPRLPVAAGNGLPVLEDNLREVVGTQAYIRQRVAGHPGKLLPVSLEQVGPDRGKATVYRAVVAVQPPRELALWARCLIVSAAVTVPLVALAWALVALVGLVASLWPLLLVLGLVAAGGGTCTTIVKVTHRH